MANNNINVVNEGKVVKTKAHLDFFIRKIKVKFKIIILDD